MAVIFDYKTGWDSATNHESNVSKAEVERLVKSGLDILITQSGTFSKHQKGDSHKILWEYAKGISNAKQNVGSSWIVEITKGIHQFTKYGQHLGRLPHITAKLRENTQVYAKGSIHIWLSSVATGLDARTGYTAKSVSHDEGGPYVPTISLIKVPSGTPARVRGNSISHADFVLETERRKREVEALNEKMGWDYLNALADLYESDTPPPFSI